MGMPISSISIWQASSANSPLLSCAPKAVLNALMMATVTVLEEPRPVPGGISEAKNMDSRSRRRNGAGWCAASSRVPSNGASSMAAVRVLAIEGAVVRRGNLQRLAVAEGAQEDVEVFVDGGVDHQAAELVIVGRQVGAAAGQGDAHRGAGDEHGGLTDSVDWWIGGLVAPLRVSVVTQA
jgi:hypothetical protein